MEPRKIAFYPGCSLESSSSGFATSSLKVLNALGIDTPELDGWTCCGATSAHAIDNDLYLGLNLRNLALAEELGYDEILAPCAACYHRLASANFEFQTNPELLAKQNARTGLTYRGSVRVRNVLDLLANVVGAAAIAPKISSPLSGLKVACYYGCLNTRVPRMEPFDSVDYPMAMDNVVAALGAQAIDWSYKTECCGASLFLSAGDVSAKLVSKILRDATARGADCIAVACPMCQTNLDSKQDAIRLQYGISSPIPVVFVTQLIGLAFGMSESDVSLKQSFVPFNYHV